MGHYAIVKVLCENNANLKCTNYQGKTAMNQAEEKDFIQIISLLNEYLEDFNINFSYWKTSYIFLTVGEPF